MSQYRRRGFSLIELMIGMTLGLFVLGGVLAMFMTSSGTAANQQRLSQVLENGRYGMQLLVDEVRRTGSRYCSAYALMPPSQNGINPLQSMALYAVPAMRQPWMPGAAAVVQLDPRLFVRGHDCDNLGTCAPVLPTAANDINVVPATGTGLGQRVRGTDVLTIRYLASDGVSIVSAAGADPVEVGSNPLSAPLEINRGDLALIAGCGAAEVFAARPQGTRLAHDTGDGNVLADLGTYSRSGDARVFNFSRDFRSVTYYVGLRADVVNPGQLVSSLFRVENGQPAEEIIEGVERFDVTFVVLDGAGATHLLTAQQVESNFPAALCPPIDTELPGGPPADCLWRGVQGVDLSILAVSTRTGPSGDEVFRYSRDNPVQQSFAVGATLPSGLPAGNRLRREFRAYAGLRNMSR